MAHVRDDLTHEFRRARWGLILRGLLALAFGIFVLARPLATVAILALAVAIWAVVAGIVAIVHAFDLRHFAKHWWLMLLVGIVSLLFGIFALTRFPGLSLAFMVLWTAWWLISVGVMEVITSAQERRAKFPWGWHMALGVIGILAGIYAIANPPVTLMALTLWIGISALALGILFLVAAGTTRKVERHVEAAVSDIDKTRRAA
jgi:uncharacterized membrane protein HdeD (DUF308 family)